MHIYQGPNPLATLLPVIGQEVARGSIKIGQDVTSVQMVDNMTHSGS